MNEEFSDSRSSDDDQPEQALENSNKGSHSARIVFMILAIVFLGVVFWYRNLVESRDQAFFKKETRLVEEYIREIVAKRDRVRTVQKEYTFDQTNLILPEKEIHTGVDTIISLNNPNMIAPKDQDYLEDEDEIAGVKIDGEAQAFPLKILNFHEAINTKIGNQPVAITYCPLCKSLVAFDRIVNGEELVFKISGNFYNNNVIFYTKGSEGNPLFSQMMFKQISGKNAGKKINTIPLELTNWKSWKKRHPETKVLSDNTGHGNNYSINPYTIYSRSDKPAYPINAKDERLPVKSFVLGVWSEDKFRAYPISEFEKQGQSHEVNITLNEKNATIHYDHDAKSLRVMKSDNGVNWMYSYWFAWHAFNPKTEVYTYQE